MRMCECMCRCARACVCVGVRACVCLSLNGRVLEENIHKMYVRVCVRVCMRHRFRASRNGWHPNGDNETVINIVLVAFRAHVKLRTETVPPKSTQNKPN